MLLIRVEDVRNSEMLMEVKKARFNLYEKRMLRVMIFVLAVYFGLMTAETVMNLMYCNDSRQLNFSNVLQGAVILSTAVVGIAFILTVKYKRSDIWQKTRTYVSPFLHLCLLGRLCKRCSSS